MFFGLFRMDFSDRLRMKRQTTIAAANLPSFNATWTTGSTLTLVSGKPIIGAFVNATGISSNTTITGVSTNVVSLSANIIKSQSNANVIMTGSCSASLLTFDSYETKYNTQSGLSFLTVTTGTPAYASTVGAFGCVGVSPFVTSSPDPPAPPSPPAPPAPPARLDFNMNGISEYSVIGGQYYDIRSNHPSQITLKFYNSSNSELNPPISFYLSILIQAPATATILRKV
jgi:hypothetical protein